MSVHIRFKRPFQPRVIEPYGVLLLSERGQFLLRGRGYTQIAPLLDGKHTVDEITTQLAGQLPAAEVLYALEMLRRNGYVVEGGIPEAPERSSFWEMLGVAPETVRQRLQGTRVSLRAFGAVATDGLATALDALGVQVADDGELAIAVVDDYLQDGLRELARETAARGRPWLLLRPVGFEIWLGPLFVPGKTGCWTCLAHRLEGHRKAEAYLMERGERGPIVLARAALPSTLQTAFGLAATEVVKWVVTGASKTLEGQVVALDMGSLERTVHTLTRRPQCPACGDPGLLAMEQQKPIALGPCPVAFSDDGGYRRMRPEEMLSRYGHHVSAITGVVGALRRVLHKSSSALTLTYVADHNFAHADEGTFFLRAGQRGRSGGKGKSDAQARASALAEAIERYSGVFQGDEARLRARFDELEGAAIHPNACMLFSERQIAERERWNQENRRYTRVPEAFDPALPIEWSPLHPLRGGEARYLPTASCYFGYGRKHPSPYAYADSNGCAAGMTREEAVFQGLMELCERDATAIWWYNRLRRPGVDLASFGDPYYAELTAYYGSIKRELWALDLTHDLGIPTFAAVSRRTDKRVQDIIFGLGAHLDPRIAMLRAVTELNQFLPAVLKVKDGDERYNWDDEGVSFWKTATLDSDPYLAPDAAVPLRTLGDYAKLGSGDLYEDILFCAGVLAKQGLETLVLDQTRPDTGLAVVRVMVPGMRHFWARFAPGRLYDVPVALGWLPRPSREEELNPYPIFF